MQSRNDDMFKVANCKKRLDLAFKLVKNQRMSDAEGIIRDVSDELQSIKDKNRFILQFNELDKVMLEIRNYILRNNNIEDESHTKIKEILESHEIKKEPADSAALPKNAVKTEKTHVKFIPIDINNKLQVSEYEDQIISQLSIKMPEFNDTITRLKQDMKNMKESRNNMITTPKLVSPKVSPPSYLVPPPNLEREYSSMIMPEELADFKRAMEKFENLHKKYMKSSKKTNKLELEAELIEKLFQAERLIPKGEYQEALNIMEEIMRVAEDENFADLAEKTYYRMEKAKKLLGDYLYL